MELKGLSRPLQRCHRCVIMVRHRHAASYKTSRQGRTARTFCGGMHRRLSTVLRSGAGHLEIAICRTLPTVQLAGIVSPLWLAAARLRRNMARTRNRDRKTALHKLRIQVVDPHTPSQSVVEPAAPLDKHDLSSVCPAGKGSRSLDHRPDWQTARSRVRPSLMATGTLLRRNSLGL